MIVSIMQPAYLPWLGYFHRIASSDIHIVLDDVLIDRNSKTKFANRNKIRTKDGWCWLTVPLKTAGNSSEMFLNSVEIADDPRWASKHWETIRCSYAKAPFFADYRDFFASTYSSVWARLPDLVRPVTNYLLKALGIETRILYSSQMRVEGTKNQLILNLCRAVGATTYISGPFGRDYLQEAGFDGAGINILFHEYKHPRYRQGFPGFEPYMSAIDLLFNHGPESHEILMRDQNPIAGHIPRSDCISSATLQTERDLS